MYVTSASRILWKKTAPQKEPYTASWPAFQVNENPNKALVRFTTIAQINHNRLFIAHILQFEFRDRKAERAILYDIARLHRQSRTISRYA